MPLRMKTRQKPPPNGWIFKQGETGWETVQWEFGMCRNDVIQHRRMNPAITQKHNLSLDPNVVDVEIDEQNALRCSKIPLAQGYIVNVDISTVPKSVLPQARPLSPSPAAKLAGAAVKFKGGLQLLYDWVGHGGAPVPKEQAESRASVCVSCGPPKTGGHNDREDLSRFFTVPVSEAIRRTLELKNHLEIKTSYDDGLFTCDMCLCPLKLKVHVPKPFLKDHTPPDELAKLPDYCWLKKELS